MALQIERANRLPSLFVRHARTHAGDYSVDGSCATKCVTKVLKMCHKSTQNWDSACLTMFHRASPCLRKKSVGGSCERNYMFDPYEHARQHGLHLHYTARLPELGRYYAQHPVIVLRAGMDTITERCVLTHELGHHHYRHLVSTPKAEMQADRWAAARLIDPNDVVECGRVWPENPEKWCWELGVTERILRAWLRDHNNQQLLAA